MVATCLANFSSHSIASLVPCPRPFLFLFSSCNQVFLRPLHCVAQPAFADDVVAVEDATSLVSGDDDVTNTDRKVWSISDTKSRVTLAISN